MRREECQGEYEWLESRGEHLRSREEKIFPKPWCWGEERGQESVWVGEVEFQRRREEGKGNGGAGINSRLLLSPDPPHEAHCSLGTGPIIWFVSRQIITQLV